MFSSLSTGVEIAEAQPSLLWLGTTVVGITMMIIGLLCLLMRNEYGPALLIVGFIVTVFFLAGTVKYKNYDAERNEKSAQTELGIKYDINLWDRDAIPKDDGTITLRDVKSFSGDKYSTLNVVRKDNVVTVTIPNPNGSNENIALSPPDISKYIRTKEQVEQAYGVTFSSSTSTSLFATYAGSGRDIVYDVIGPENEVYEKIIVIRRDNDLTLHVPDASDPDTYSPLPKVKD